MRNDSPGKVIAASALGVAAGVMQFIGMPFSIICVFGTIIAPVLFAWAGLLPAAIYLAVSVGSLALLMGPGMAAAGALVFGVPSAVVIALMRRRAPFFTRMKAAVIAQLGALLALVLLLYAVLGRSLVDVAMELFAQWTDSMSPQLATLTLQQFALTGAGTLMPLETAQQILAGEVSRAETLAMLRGIYETTGQALRLGLSAMLVSSGLVTGLFATVLPSLICARRGDIDYVPLREWYVPPQVTAGALVCLATASILFAMKTDGAESVLNAVLTGGMVIYATAGAAAFSRRCAESGRSKAFRVVMLIAGLWLAPRFVAAIGICSVLFGRRGLISGFVKKKMNDHNREDDD